MDLFENRTIRLCNKKNILCFVSFETPFTCLKIKMNKLFQIIVKHQNKIINPNPQFSFIFNQNLNTPLRVFSIDYVSKRSLILHNLDTSTGSELQSTLHQKQSKVSVKH